MTLLAALLEILSEWREAFPQQRSWKKAARQGVGFLACLGRRTLSRIIWTNGGQQRSWSSEYFLHSRCRWDAEQLFAPILRRGLEGGRGRLVGGAGGRTPPRPAGRRVSPSFFLTRPPVPPPSPQPP